MNLKLAIREGVKSVAGTIPLILAGLLIVGSLVNFISVTMSAGRVHELMVNCGWHHNMTVPLAQAAMHVRDDCSSVHAPKLSQEETL